MNKGMNEKLKSKPLYFNIFVIHIFVSVILQLTNILIFEGKSPPAKISDFLYEKLEPTRSLCKIQFSSAAIKNK